MEELKEVSVIGKFSRKDKKRKTNKQEWKVYQPQEVMDQTNGINTSLFATHYL